MPFKTHFSPSIIKQLAKDFGLPDKQLQEAIEEGERVWDLTRRDNQEDQENMEKIRKILQQIRDYQRGKQNKLNAEVRELITWYQTYYRVGPRPTTEAEAIEHIKFIFSRPSGQRQVNRYNPDIDLEALRQFSWPLQELWTRLAKSWTVASNDPTRRDEQSKAERFFFACASQLEPDLSQANVRSAIMRPFPTKDEWGDDPSDYDGMAMVLTKHGPVIKKLQ